MAQVMHYGVHLTRCVDPANYAPLPPEGVGFVTVGPASFGKKICDYLLYGKLVCMASEPVCVIGTIVGLEHTSYGKSGPDAIDNDFSFNLLLAPYRPKDLRRYAVPGIKQHIIFRDVARHAPQGELIEDRAGRLAGLVPREPADVRPVDGYGVMWHFPKTGPPTTASDPDEKRQANLNKLTAVEEADGVTIAIPVLHCEAEGSRIFAVCTALAPFLDILSGKLPGSPGPSATEICHATLGWIPFVGDVFCAIVETLIDIAMLPIVLAAAAAAAVAWAAAQAFDDQFSTGTVSRFLKMGDVVVVQGVWTWDSGHAGHLELHPVRAIAKLTGEAEGADPVAPVPAGVAARLNDLKDRWCRLLNDAPPPVVPPGVRVPNTPGMPMTTHQQQTALTQQQPEHQWTVHPVIDGCCPARRRRRPRRWAVSATDTSLARRLWCPECMLRFGRAILAWTVILGVINRRRRRRS